MTTPSPPTPSPPTPSPPTPSPSPPTPVDSGSGDLGLTPGDASGISGPPDYTIALAQALATGDQSFSPYLFPASAGSGQGEDTSVGQSDGASGDQASPHPIVAAAIDESDLPPTSPQAASLPAGLVFTGFSSPDGYGGQIQQFSDANGQIWDVHVDSNGNVTSWQAPTNVQSNYAGMIYHSPLFFDATPPPRGTPVVFPPDFAPDPTQAAPTPSPANPTAPAVSQPPMPVPSPVAITPPPTPDPATANPTPAPVPSQTPQTPPAPVDLTSAPIPPAVPPPMPQPGPPAPGPVPYDPMADSPITKWLLYGNDTPILDFLTNDSNLQVAQNVALGIAVGAATIATGGMLLNAAPAIGDFVFEASIQVAARFPTLTSVATGLGNALTWTAVPRLGIGLGGAALAAAAAEELPPLGQELGSLGPELAEGLPPTGPSFEGLIDPSEFENDPEIIDRLSRAREFDIGGYQSLTGRGEFGRVGDNLDADEALQNAYIRLIKDVERVSEVTRDNPSIALSPELHRLIQNLQTAQMQGLTPNQVLQYHLQQMTGFTPDYVLQILEREAQRYINTTF